MNFTKTGLSILFCTLSIVTVNLAHADGMKDAFSEGKFQGQLRAYNNTLAFQHANDKYGSAFGGRLGYETKASRLFGFSLGMAYYSSNDLGTNHADPAARAPFTPTTDIDVMGEAFVRWAGYDTVVTAGRQLLDTPFANPADAFMIPITFTGYSLVNKSVEGLTVNLHQLISVKDRQSATFENIGAFTANRLAVAPQNTAGTSIIGLTYDREKLKVQAWHYGFAELFNLEWLQADYEFAGETYAPYVSAHYGLEKDTGGRQLGTVDSALAGAKAGVKAFGANLSLGVDNVSRNRFISPFSYFTDAAYTNSMITGMGNVDAGTAYKVSLLYNFNPQVWGKISHSKLNFKGDKDTSETDLDAQYKFTDSFENLSLLLRAGYRRGSPPAGLADLIEYRTQLQYVF